MIWKDSSLTFHSSGVNLLLEHFTITEASEAGATTILNLVSDIRLTMGASVNFKRLNPCPKRIEPGPLPLNCTNSAVPLEESSSEELLVLKSDKLLGEESLLLSRLHLFFCSRVVLNSLLSMSVFICNQIVIRKNQEAKKPKNQGQQRPYRIV